MLVTRTSRYLDTSKRGVLLFDSTLGSDAASIDTGANAIDQGFDALRIIALVRTTEAVAVSTLKIQFNGDTGNNYDRIRLRGANATASVANTLADPQVLLVCAGASCAANVFSPVDITIPAYRQTTAQKAGVWLNGIPDTTAANTVAEEGSFNERATSAINQVKITAGSGNLKTGSRLSIYGE